MNITRQTAPRCSIDIDRLALIANEAINHVDSDTLVPQSRCVDVLLDLYNATNDDGLKWLIGERIDELRGRSFVLGDVWCADLEAIVAIAHFTRLSATSVPPTHRYTSGVVEPLRLSQLT